MLCNATPRDKRKTQKPKNKEQQLQRKSNEAQGLGKTRQMRDIKSHQLLDEWSETYFYEEVW